MSLPTSLIELSNMSRDDILNILNNREIYIEAPKSQIVAAAKLAANENVLSFGEKDLVNSGYFEQEVFNNSLPNNLPMRILSAYQLFNKSRDNSYKPGNAGLPGREGNTNWTPGLPGREGNTNWTPGLPGREV